MNVVDLYNEFFMHCGVALRDMTFTRIETFVQAQWPIVVEALLNDAGISACDARAHDLTCGFVERKLIESRQALTAALAKNISE